jgi:hypothetical protein
MLGQAVIGNDRCIHFWHWMLRDLIGDHDRRRRSGDSGSRRGGVWKTVIRSASWTKTLAFKVSPTGLTGFYGWRFFRLQWVTAVRTKRTIFGIFCLASITAHRCSFTG